VIVSATVQQHLPVSGVRWVALDWFANILAPKAVMRPRPGRPAMVSSPLLTAGGGGPPERAFRWSAFRGGGPGTSASDQVSDRLFPRAHPPRHPSVDDGIDDANAIEARARAHREALELGRHAEPPELLGVAA
jgi:hypothetical protein